MRYDAKRPAKPALELIEEATHMLRGASAPVLAAYYAGAVPFVVGILYFWADMSRSPFASKHLAEASLGAAALFLWMKTWHVFFAQRILAQMAGRPMPSWTIREAARVFLFQAIIQPSGLFVIPLAAIVMAPLGWVYAFYQNVTVLGLPISEDLSQIIKRAWKQAQLWPLENHFILGAGFLFGGCVFLNWFVVCLSIPGVLKMFFGIESAFNRSVFSMLNTTFFAVISSLTYLSIDPILKTVYALRCFYGESLRSGEDLKIGLKEFSALQRRVNTKAQRHRGTKARKIIYLTRAFVPLCLCAFVLTPTGSAAAQQTAPSISPVVLDQQIDQVIHQSKYAWRMPRVPIGEESEKGIVSRFLAEIANLMRSAFRAALNWIEALLREWFRLNPDGSNSPLGWVTSSLLLYVLLAAVLGLMALFLLRVWRRDDAVVSIAAEAVPQLPDVADENIGADHLPEDGWIRLAQELLERRELRLAMRAFYLSSLAHLAQRNLITLAKFKSNRDYEAELRRRAHAVPELLPVFADNVSIFERIWYGMYDVNPELIHQFAGNIKRLTDLKLLQQS